MIEGIGIGIIANACYRAFELGAEKFVDNFKGIIRKECKEAIAESDIDFLIDRIKKLSINADMKSSAVERIMASDEEIVKISRKIKNSENFAKRVEINQINTSGDNVVGNLNF